MANELGGHARDSLRAAEAVVERQAELIDLSLESKCILSNLECKRQRLRAHLLEERLAHRTGEEPRRASSTTASCCSNNVFGKTENLGFLSFSSLYRWK